MNNDLKKLNLEIGEELLQWGFSNHSISYNIEPIILDSDVINKWNTDIISLINLLRRLAETENVFQKNNSNMEIDTSFVTRTKFNPIIARPDCILSNGNLKIIETNIDSSLGGMMQISKFTELYRKYYSSELQLKFDSPLEGLIKVFKKSIENKVKSVLFLLTERFSDYDTKYCVKFLKYLKNKSNIDGEIKTLSDLKYHTLKDINSIKAKYSLIYRFDVIKGNTVIDKRLNQFLSVCEMNDIVIISETKDLRIEDKGSLATLTKLSSNNSGLISLNEKQLIDKYISKTVFLSDLIKNNLSLDLNTRFRQFDTNKDDFVLKRLYSFGGQHVISGKYCSNEEWNKVINTAKNESDIWVIQEYNKSDDIEDFREKNDKPDFKKEFTISPFIFGNNTFSFLVRTFNNKNHKGVAGLRSGAEMGFVMVAEKLKNG